MRILGFRQKWPKLSNPIFTTFRFFRRDRDWEVGEIVRIVYKPRSPEREVLGLAKIIRMKPLYAEMISEAEAATDGFDSYQAMWEWLRRTYKGKRLPSEPMNKLTLEWVKGGRKCSAQR